MLRGKVLNKLDCGICLVDLVGLYGVVGDHIERLEVEPDGGEDHPPRLLAQRRNAAANKLKQDVLILILEPPRIEPLICLMSLHLSQGFCHSWIRTTQLQARLGRSYLQYYLAII